MKLNIRPDSTLKEIQNEFHQAFPMLKLHFFKNPHGQKESSAKKNMLDDKLKVKEVTKGKGEINITGKTRVNELEQQFRSDFGLFAQVFRKSGNVWLETTTTDSWTLDQQQEAAKQSETTYNYSFHNFADNRE